MTSNPLPNPNTRLGFHYYPDTLHYRDSDLQSWLPELRRLGASWLVLRAPVDRAVPEPFLRELIKAGIEPILHFSFSLVEPPNPRDIMIFLDSYAKWGVHYVIFFDRPNSRSSWSPTTWGQEDLVERFLDRFIPLADYAVRAGLTPVFPPLEPGGNYWDTAFLRTALISLQRRKQGALLERIVMSAYAWTHDRSLNWGAGGPERWPGAHPYFTPQGEEDQRGFRIFDWYLAIARTALKRPVPILLLGGGCTEDPSNSPNLTDLNIHAQRNLSIAQLMAGTDAVNDPGSPDLLLEAVPAEVLVCNFWLLSAQSPSNFLTQAWYQPDGQPLPVVDSLKQWYASQAGEPQEKTTQHASQDPIIAHYLLLPAYEWGIADWHLEIIRPFVKKYQPTIGFSLNEAEYAARVTVIGNPQVFSEDTLNRLRAKGIFVERITGDGTNIASQLAER